MRLRMRRSWKAGRIEYSDAHTMKVLVVRRDNIGGLVCTTPLISACISSRNCVDNWAAGPGLHLGLSPGDDVGGIPAGRFRQGSSQCLTPSGSIGHLPKLEGGKYLLIRPDQGTV